MQAIIDQILEKYPTARATTSFGGPHEIQQLFQTLRIEIENLEAIRGNPNLVVKSSYGKGNWAAVPWLAILDSRETDTTQDGTYVVLLFKEDGQGCHLKLAQGVTKLHNAMGSGATAELTRRATEVRNKFPDMNVSGFDLSGDPRLGSENKLSRLYESSTIISKYWEKHEVPSDQIFESDLNILIDYYERYVEHRLAERAQEPSINERVSRTWAISAGENGRLWEDFYKNSFMAIGWDNLGDLLQYETQDIITNILAEHSGNSKRPTNDSLCCYQFSREMGIGDIVIAKAGRMRVLGAGIIESEYIYDPSREEYKNLRKVRWLKSAPAEWPGTGTAFKALTEISLYPTFISFVHAYLGDQIEKPSEDPESIKPYSISDIVNDGCFLDALTLKKYIDRLRIKKNIIIQGPPGTGKTWLARRLAYALIGQKDSHRVRAVQFHPNLSYEDFVRGFRPSSEGKLSLVDGAFMEAIEDARNTSEPYIVVIEEINRGNPAQIFGEMLTLLESDKRYPDEALELSYRRYTSERVFIPSNLYVIGTMNIADRSLALVDMALRRRFAFIDLKPNFNQSWRDWLVNRSGIPENIVQIIEQRIVYLNDVISNDTTLGPQFKIGHSYVTPPLDVLIDDAREWFIQVVETEIKPLLDEYWFDSPDKAGEEKDRLVFGL
jgi:5-methylcytosine-specific restriction protein B